jgi:hypothetical protein
MARMSRRKKTAIYVVGAGILIGVGAAFVLPWWRRRQQQPSITIPEGEIQISSSTPAQQIVSYDATQPINEGALTFLTPEQRLALEWGA